MQIPLSLLAENLNNGKPICAKVYPIRPEVRGKRNGVRAIRKRVTYQRRHVAVISGAAREQLYTFAPRQGTFI